MKSFFRFLRGNPLYLMMNVVGLALSLMFVISVPVSWVLMSDWLKSFSYRIPLSPWIFIAVGLFVLAIALISVYFQVERAARSNPADSLKIE